MSFDIEQFNAHQEDVRRRLDSLAKAIFLLSGGALTLSINVFIGENAPEITEGISCILKASWWAFFASIIFVVLTLTIVILRDYFFGEKWRKELNGGQADTDDDDKNQYIDTLIIIFGLLGIVGFLSGFCAQAIVATTLI